ncbi:MAG: PqqD family protein [Ignavibacteriaceae bacterium]|nr:PqqD family protein [Ignavibacteriaceae bacterium]
MPLSFRERRKILKNVNYLEITPFRIHSEEVDENGLVTVLIPKFKRKFAIDALTRLGKPLVIRIKLDEFGSETWLQLNGKQNVSAISKNLIQKFGEKIQPVEERLTRFLTNLYLQGFISFNEIKAKGN